MGEPNKEVMPSAPAPPPHLSMIMSPKAAKLGLGGLISSPQTTADRNKVRERTNPNVGIFDEQVLTLVFRCLNWDPQTLCSAACTSRRMRAVADRILFFELCLSRAPRLVASLVFMPKNPQPKGVVGSSPRIPGGWAAIAKLLLFCCGCEPSKLFAPSDAMPGHFVPMTRFSKTSGKSFLVRRCWGDVLYVSDPCEHAHPAGEDEDLGVYSSETAMQGSVWQIHAVTHSGVPNREEHPAAHAHQMPVLRCARVEHDGSRADPEKRLEKARHPRGQTRVFRLRERAPPRQLLARSALL